MTPERIAELRALCERATDGPWHRTDEMIHRADWQHVCTSVKTAMVATVTRKHSDGEFIVASRTALPELLKEVERLKAMIGQ